MGYRIEDLNPIRTLGAHASRGVAMKIAGLGAIDNRAIHQSLCCVPGFFPGHGAAEDGSDLRLDRRVVLASLLFTQMFQL